MNNPAKPTFGNTIVALERQGALLNRISGVFYNLLSSNTSEEMQRIAAEVQPRLTALQNDIALNPELFARVKAVYEHPGWCLSKEDKVLLEKTYKSFARNGAALPDADKELYRQYSTELTGLTQAVDKNALAATNATNAHITNPDVPHRSGEGAVPSVYDGAERPEAEGRRERAGCYQRLRAQHHRPEGRG